MLARRLGVLFLAGLAACAHAPAAPETALPDCAALTALAIPHVTITEATAVAAVPAAVGKRALPAYCRVLAISRPVPDSEIRFEVAIPLGPAWTGRYQQLGNGGFAGLIPEDDIVGAVAQGDAAAGTDDGHVSKHALDASWALGHPEKVIDFGYRAVKETHDASLEILRAFTGRRPTHTYFVGCSDGGRGALMEAQRYPGDFDGIVAGAPANYATHLLFGMASNANALARTPGSYVPRGKLAAIAAAAQKACGDVDGLIRAPLDCHFDPGVLLCLGTETDACLTAEQIAALRTIYSAVRNPRTHALIEPGFEPGNEAGDGSWSDWIVGTAPGEAGRAAQYRLTSTFFRFMVFANPQYQLAQLDFDIDLATVETTVAPIIDSIDPDLRAFERRGGKLLQFHGWNDPVIPPRDSLRYFESVEAKLGNPRNFYRLFLAPGMLHCDGGRGPNTLATVAAIRAWVEEGTAPDQLLATKYPGDDPSKPPERTEPLCPYPQRAEWNGSGDRHRPESYRCTTPAAR